MLTCPVKGLRMRTSRVGIALNISNGAKRMAVDSLKDAFAGGLGGLGCVLAGQPMDTVKVKQQTYPQVYRSMYQTIAKTYLEGGIVGFYAGCGSAVVANVAENAVLFMCFEHCQQIVRWYTGVRHSGEMLVLHKASAGALASVVSSVAINPVERIKCKLQVQDLQQQLHGVQNSSGRRPQRLNSWAVLSQILREEGVLGLFRGLTSTWAREVPGYFFFFGGYSASRRLLTPPGCHHEDLSVWRLALAGGMAGCCFWTAMFPTDVVKSRVQVKGELSGSFWVTTFDIIRREGVLALYRGLLATVIRSFPSNGVLFVTYEYTRQLLLPPAPDPQ